MRHLYLDKNWLFTEIDNMIKFVGGFDNIWSYKLYNYYLINFKKKKHNSIFNQVENFIESNNSYMNLNHKL